ncbi:hypothetical protein Lesp01_88800 [Lentzea sp. NBRC 102530]|nr:hypothetical protein Lesp01_88800 [Lentzea sp. NBRC 102530]
MDNFHASRRCGCNPNAFQIRVTAVWVNPDSAAIDRVDQCVALADSSAAAITTSTCSSEVVRGRPGRASSSNPSTRSITNRERHFATVPRCTPNSAAISLFEPPSAHHNTIRARNASACAVFRRRAQPSNALASSSDSTSSGSFGFGMLPNLRLHTNR